MTYPKDHESDWERRERERNERWKREADIERRNSIIAKGIVIAAIVLPFLWLAYAEYTHLVVGYEFSKHVQGFFDTADRASDAKTKSLWFDKFIASLGEQGLTDGKASVWQTDKPQSDLATQYQVALSLQKRLHEIASMDPLSPQYQFAMNQITLQEFCWFPIGTFEGGFFLDHGAWGPFLFPPDVVNRCGGKD